MAPSSRVSFSSPAEDRKIASSDFALAPCRTPRLISSLRVFLPYYLIINRPERSRNGAFMPHFSGIRNTKLRPLDVHGYFIPPLDEIKSSTGRHRPDTEINATFQIGDLPQAPPPQCSEFGDTCAKAP